MNLLFIGDIVGKPGRDVVVAELPRLRDQLKLDCVIANGENAAGGFGLTRAIADEFFAAGVDVISTTAGQFAATLRRDADKYGRLIRDLGIKGD